MFWKQTLEHRSAEEYNGDAPQEKRTAGRNPFSGTCSPHDHATFSHQITTCCESVTRIQHAVVSRRFKGAYGRARSNRGFCIAGVALYLTSALSQPQFVPSALHYLVRTCWHLSYAVMTMSNWFVCRPSLQSTCRSFNWRSYNGAIKSSVKKTPPT